MLWLHAMTTERQTGAMAFMEAMAERRAAWPLSKKLAVWAKWNIITPTKLLPLKVKWFVQRGRRGWSDCDLSNMASYVAYVNAGMIGQLKRQAHGFPCDLEYDKMLVDPADATKFLVHIQDLDELLGLGAGVGGMGRWQALLSHFEEGWQAAFRYDGTWDPADREVFESMMPLYTEYFPSLWD